MARLNWADVIEQARAVVTSYVERVSPSSATGCGG